MTRNQISAYKSRPVSATTEQLQDFAQQFGGQFLAAKMGFHCFTKGQGGCLMINDQMVAKYRFCGRVNVGVTGIYEQWQDRWLIDYVYELNEESDYAAEPLSEDDRDEGERRDLSWIR